MRVVLTHCMAPNAKAWPSVFVLSIKSQRLERVIWTVYGTQLSGGGAGPSAGY